MKKFIALALTAAVSCAYADSSELNAFLAQAKTLKADFTQTVISGKKTRTSAGTMEIERPNKFRWEYTAEQQLIVSDAKNIYIYDKPLQQVTVKALGQSLDKSPAAVLAGANTVQKLYVVNDIGSSKKDGLKWVEILPKAQNDNNGFQRVAMGFTPQHQLSTMEFIDNFGNHTILKFSNLQTGIKLPESDFKFTPPAGVDVSQQ